VTANLDEVGTKFLYGKSKMLKRKTAFVIGAGASCEAGLPTGQNLRSKVAEALDLRFQYGYQQLSGSEGVWRALVAAAGNAGLRDPRPYNSAAWMIRDAMPLTLSIDNFIDAHRGDAVVETCGKVAISHVILKAEQESSLFVNLAQGERSLDHKKLEGTWYPKLFQLLSEGIDKSQLDGIFENASFIVFNYDRCLEYYLYEALVSYYALPEGDAQRLVSSATIVHPYGTVGDLHWEDRLGLSLGAQVGGERLLEISTKLRTFTEQYTDADVQKQIASIMDAAETLVFLGFAFHEQNMEILGANESREPRKVFATALAVSRSDCEAITVDIRKLYASTIRKFDIEIRNDLKCADLFDQYSRSLRAS